MNRLEFVQPALGDVENVTLNKLTGSVLVLPADFDLFMVRLMSWVVFINNNKNLNDYYYCKNHFPYNDVEY